MTIFNDFLFSSVCSLLCTLVSTSSCGPLTAATGAERRGEGGVERRMATPCAYVVLAFGHDPTYPLQTSNAVKIQIWNLKISVQTSSFENERYGQILWQ